MTIIAHPTKPYRVARYAFPLDVFNYQDNGNMGQHAVRFFGSLGQAMAYMRQQWDVPSTRHVRLDYVVQGVNTKALRFKPRVRSIKTLHLRRDCGRGIVGKLSRRGAWYRALGEYML